MSDTPRAKRVVKTGYTSVSCDECYANKRKCEWPESASFGDGGALVASSSGEPLVCRRCTKLNLACLFNRPAKNKLAKRRELQAMAGADAAGGEASRPASRPAGAAKGGRAGSGSRAAPRGVKVPAGAYVPLPVDYEEGKDPGSYLAGEIPDVDFLQDLHSAAAYGTAFAGNEYAGDLDYAQEHGLVLDHGFDPGQEFATDDEYNPGGDEYLTDDYDAYDDTGLLEDPLAEDRGYEAGYGAPRLPNASEAARRSSLVQTFDQTFAAAGMPTIKVEAQTPPTSGPFRSSAGAAQSLQQPQSPDDLLAEYARNLATRADSLASSTSSLFSTAFPVSPAASSYPSPDPPDHFVVPQPSTGGKTVPSRLQQNLMSRTASASSSEPMLSPPPAAVATSMGGLIPLPVGGTPHLPELSLLLNIYFDNICPHIEFIHKSTFFASLHQQPQYLLDSMCALAVPFIPAAGLSQLPKVLFQRASSHLLTLDPMPRALPAAWTFINLALHAMLHESSTQRAMAAAHGFQAMAASTGHSLRKAADLRGRYPAVRDWLEAESRRRTWFSVWMIGTVLEAASGNRQSISFVDKLLPIPCSDPVWRRNRGKRDAGGGGGPPRGRSGGAQAEPEWAAGTHMGMFVDLGRLFGNEDDGMMEPEGRRAASQPPPVSSAKKPAGKFGVESKTWLSKPYPSLSMDDLPGALEKYYADLPPLLPQPGPTPMPPHNAFAGIVELHGLLEHAMSVARGDNVPGKGKLEVERALLRWEEMWDRRKTEIGAKVWFGGTIVLRTALGLVHGIPSPGFRLQSLRIAELLASLTDQQLLHIGPPFICLSIHSAGLALIELLDQPPLVAGPVSPRRGIEVCLNALKLHAGRWPLSRVLAKSLEEAVGRWQGRSDEAFVWTGLGSLDLGEEGVVGDEESEDEDADIDRRKR